MKKYPVVLVAVVFNLLCLCFLFAQEETTIVAPTSEAAEGLDLKAVSELFKDAQNLEEFEKALNDPEQGINNLDLDSNNEVDYIRVVEEIADGTHLIILQAALAENEFQDVATIEVEKTGDEGYNMQVHGNEVIYGAHYYIAPGYVHIHTWPIITWIYRPVYRPYRSVFYFGYYPRWWRPFRPVSIHVYRTRTVGFTSRTTFTFSRTSRVKSVRKVNYRPRSTTLVKKKTRVSHPAGVTTGAKKVTRKTGPGGKTTTVKAGVKKTTNKKTGKTTVKAGVKKTTNKKTGKTTVKGGVKKTTRTKGGKKTTVKKGGAKKTVKRKKK